MKLFNVTKIDTNEIVLQQKTYTECIDWIESFGNILEYTTVEIQ